jgi:hypothetical protein
MARWTKGHSGNPGGRPKKGNAIAELARAQVEKHKLIEKLGSIGARANEYTDVDVDQQLRAVQLLLAYAYGPPRAEIEATEGLQIQVIYAETNHIAISSTTPGATPSHSGSEAIQRRLLRETLGQDGAGDGPPDPSGPTR